MATVEQIAAIVEAVMAAKTTGTATTSRTRKTLDERQFRRLTQFSGGEVAWKDWAFQFRAALRGADRNVAEVIDWIERADERGNTLRLCNRKILLRPA
jgi:hypothetical protein